MPAVLFDVRFALIQATNVGNNHTVVCKIKSFQIQIIGEKKEEKQNQKRMTIASSTGFF